MKKPQKGKSYIMSRNGAKHAMRERTRGAGFHDSRPNRQRTRSAELRQAIKDFS